MEGNPKIEKKKNSKGITNGRKARIQSLGKKCGEC